MCDYYRTLARETTVALHEALRENRRLRAELEALRAEATPLRRAA
jgi:hypothetical protein